MHVHVKDSVLNHNREYYIYNSFKCLLHEKLLANTVLDVL